MKINCSYCGKKLNKKPSEIKRAKNSYCDIKCKKLDQTTRNHKGMFQPKHNNQVLNGYILCTNCLKYKTPNEFYRARHLKHRLEREYFCKKCRDITRKRDYQKEKPAKMKNRSKLTPFLKSIIQHAKNRSTRKGYDFNITYEYLKFLYDKNQGLCSLSGEKMTTIAGQGKVMTNLSIDRVDSSKGYIEGNIQLVCYITNIMKQQMSSQELVDWANKITQYNG